MFEPTSTGSVAGLVGLAASSFAIAFSGALMPGPLLVATVDLSVRYGARSGPLLVLGHGLLELALVGLLVLGLAPLMSSNSVLAAVGLGGAVMLWWMAAGMLRAGSIDDMGGTSLSSRLHPTWAGVVLSVLNPYWAVWWATIGLAYVVASRRFGLPGLAAFFLAHVAADLVWYAAVSTAVSRGKSLLTPRAFRALAVGCAAMLIFSGGLFAWLGLHLLSS
jgi:threonine/homoserine/homoserine lactone efflux protein